MPSRVLPLRAPLLWLFLPLSAGLGVAHVVPLPAIGPWPFLALAAGAAWLALHAARRNQPGWWLAGFVVAVALAGYVMLHVRFPYLHEWSRRPPREVTLIIEVRRPFPPAPSARALAGLAVITASPENDPALRGRQISYAADRRTRVVPQRSGRYLVQGVIEPLVPDAAGAGFNDYLANAGVRHRLTRARILGEVGAPDRFQAWCAAIEDRLATILGRGLAPQPGPRSLYVAMLLGEKAVMDPRQQDAFMQSGTFHIFSISGLHVAAIGLALKILFSLVRLPARPSAVLTIGLLWVYVQITGNSSPALRAFLMVAFLLGSRVFQLPANPLAALIASAVAILLLDPLQLFSTGFQMSYAVVAALILMGRPLADQWLERWQPFALRPKPDWRKRHHRIHNWGRKAIGTLAVSWSAFLASAPSGIGFFGLLSPGSLLANLIVIPLSTVVIYTGFISLLAGLLGLAPLSSALNLLAAWFITVIERLLQTGLQLPGMFFHAQFRTAWLAPLSLALMTGIMLFGASVGWVRRWGGYWPPFVLLVLLLIFGVKYG